jgi:hypothetical protein
MIKRFFLIFSSFLLLSGIFSSSGALGFSIPVAHADNTCRDIDLLWVVDLSSTMNGAIGGASKLQAVRSASRQINSGGFLGPNSRAALVTFNSSQVRNYPPTGFTSNFATVNSALTSATVGNDRHLLAQGVNAMSAPIGRHRADNQNSSIQRRLYTILVTDGAPNRDEQNRNYTTANVAGVNISNADGSFKSVTEVAQIGPNDPGAGQPVGFPISQVMQRTLNLQGLLSADDEFNTVALDGVNSQLHMGVADYFSKVGGVPTNSGDVARISNSADLYNAMAAMIECSGVGNGGPVTCSGPATAPLDAPVTFTATGGTGSVTWSAPGATPASASNITVFTTTFRAADNTAGASKTVTVTRGGQSANCMVTLSFAAVACTSSPQTANIGDRVTITATGGNPASYAWSGDLGTVTPQPTAASFQTTYNSNGVKNITVRSDSRDGTCQVNIGIASQTALVIELPPAWKIGNNAVTDRLFYPKQLHLSATQENGADACFSQGNFTSSDQFNLDTNNCNVSVATELVTSANGTTLDPEQQFYRITITGSGLLNIDPDLRASKIWQEKVLKALGFIRSDTAQAFAPPPAGNIFGILPQPVSCAPASQTTTVNQQVSFTASGGNNVYSWSASGGNPTSGTGTSFGTRYGTTGSKTVTVTSDGLSANCTVTVNAGGGGALACAPTTQNAVVGQPVTLTASGGNANNYSWLAASGNPTNGTGPNFTTTFSIANTHSVRLSDSGTNSVFCQIVVTNATGPTCSPASQTVAINQQAILTASGGSNYSWSAPSGNPTSGTGSSFGTAYATAGTYIITLSSGSQTTTCQVTVTAAQVVCSPASQNAYIAQTVTVSASLGDGTYSWSAPNATTTSGAGANFATSYTAAGSYVITVTSAGQTGQCAVTITTPPELTCSVDQAIVLRNQAVTATAVGGINVYEWSTAGGTPDHQGPSGQSTFVTSYATVGQKTITLVSGLQTKACQVDVRAYVNKTINYRLLFHNGNQGDTFKTATLTAVKTYLQTHTSVTDSMALADNGNCIAPAQLATASFACFKTKVYYTIAGRAMPQALVIQQSIPLSGGGPNGGSIVIEGNVAGGGELKDFVPTSSAVILGGTINVPGGTQRSGYLGTAGFNQAAVRAAIGPIFDRRSEGQSFSITGSNNTYGYSGNQWRLNAAGASPTGSTATSGSTPPEGKLWNVIPANASSSILPTLTLGDVTFSGSGTIAFPGNVQFNGYVHCDANTRLGVIANGNISFQNPDVSCGAFIAFNQVAGNDSIDFPDAITASNQADTTGMFVATGDINLPSSVAAGLTYNIKYDKAFAASPTTLFKEILKVIVQNSS